MFRLLGTLLGRVGTHLWAAHGPHLHGPQIALCTALLTSIGLKSYPPFDFGSGETKADILTMTKLLSGGDDPPRKNL